MLSCRMMNDSPYKEDQMAVKEILSDGYNIGA
jgi:hypothetical protein